MEKQNDYNITTPEAWYVIASLSVRLTKLKQEQRWLEKYKDRTIAEKGARVHYQRVRRNKGRMTHTYAILEKMREHFNIPADPKSVKIEIETP